MENDLTFETTLLQTGNNTGIRVPDEIVERLGAGKKPPVNVTINDFTYQSTVAVMGGRFMIPVSAAIRCQAAIKGGDNITVKLRLDSEPRTPSLPTDFQQALDDNPAAKVFFETLPNSARKKYILLIDEAKTTETRRKRLEKAITDLVAGKK